MGAMSNYQQIIRNLLIECASHKPSHGQIETEVVIDEAQGHYEVLHIGWQGNRRVHGIVLHIDIINDKIWIQYDGTERGIALELVEAGVPKEAIVLGFKPEHIRPYTEFAVA